MSGKYYNPFEVDQHITALSRYYAGKMGSRFFNGLKNEKKILGCKCPGCGRVYWPPRQTCGPCFRDMTVEDMVEIGPRGTVESFTRIEYSSAVMPRKAPFCYVLVKLDGADTSMAHFLEAEEPAAVTSGMRVEAVFAEDRKGGMLDISHFKPVAE